MEFLCAHELALQRILLEAFPVATLKWPGRRQRRFGTEADVIYGLNKKANASTAAFEAANLPHDYPEEIIDKSVVSTGFLDSKTVPFYSTGTLFGDCLRYCPVGAIEKGAISLPPLLAPRLRPRKLTLDCIVLLPGYDVHDFQKVVTANLLRSVPKIRNFIPEDAKKKPIYVKRKEEKDNNCLFEKFGVRILSDCVEIAIAADISCTTSYKLDLKNTEPTEPRTYRCWRTMYVGIADMAWTPGSMNTCITEKERSACRVACGFSQETAIRSFPAPFIEASRMLRRFSNSVLGAQDELLSQIFWLHCAIFYGCKLGVTPNLVINEILNANLGNFSALPPPSQWTVDCVSSALFPFCDEEIRENLLCAKNTQSGGYPQFYESTWKYLNEKKPVVSLPHTFNFEIIKKPYHAQLIAAAIAEAVLNLLKVPKKSIKNFTLVPSEVFFNTITRKMFLENVEKIIKAARAAPLNIADMMD